METKAQARPRVVVAWHLASGGSLWAKRRSWELLTVDVGIRDLPAVVVGVGDDGADECEWRAAVAAAPWRTGMLGANDAAVDDSASDCTIVCEYDDAAATSEVVEEVVDTMLLDASAAADARAPTMVDDDDIFLAPPPLPAPLLPLDDGKSGLGSMTLVLPLDEEEERAAAVPAAVPATPNFRRFFSGSSPRRQGLRYS